MSRSPVGLCRSDLCWVTLAHRRSGVGTAILESLLDLGRELGCAEAWVLSERGNQAAMRLYTTSGGREQICWVSAHVVG